MVIDCKCFLLFLQNSGQEFHDDLYPDTVGTTPAMSAEEWWQGGNKQVMILHPQVKPRICSVCTPQTLSCVCAQVEKVSLNPDKRPKPKPAPAKQTPAKKEVSSGGSKEVRHTSAGIIFVVHVT